MDSLIASDRPSLAAGSIALIHLFRGEREVRLREAEKGSGELPGIRCGRVWSGYPRRPVGGNFFSPWQTQFPRVSALKNRMKID